MGSTHTSLKSKPMLFLSVILFIVYVANILMGMTAIKSGSALPYLSDVWEFLVLLSAVATGVIFVLLNEHESPE